MIEPEIAFADLNDDADLAEDFLKYIFKALLDERPRRPAPGACGRGAGSDAGR